MLKLGIVIQYFIKNNLLIVQQYVPGDATSKIILISSHGGRRDAPSVPKRLAGCQGVVGEQGVSREGCEYKVAHTEYFRSLDFCYLSYFYNYIQPYFNIHIICTFYQI